MATGRTVYRPINSCWGYGQQMDNSHSTIQKLSTLYCDPEMSDLQLVVGDKVFHTHKLILSISSDVLKTMLTSPTWPESSKDQIVLQEDLECVDVFGDFLHYLYTGRIHMSHLTVLPILSLADKYNIGDLTSLCIDYMCSHYVAPRHTSRVLSWYMYATMCGHKRLERVCEDYIQWNFQYVVETDDFLSASAEIIVHFFKSPNIVVKSELSLYLAVKRWIINKISCKESTPSSKCLTSTVHYIVKNISMHTKFTLMTVSELKSLQDDWLVVNYPDILTRPIQAALQVHIAQTSIAQTDSQTPPTEGSIKSHCESPKSPDHTAMSQTHVDHENQLVSCSLEPGYSGTDHQLGGASGASNHPSADVPLVDTIRTSSALVKPESPRIYTCDSWCTEMVVSEVGEITPGDVLVAFFSTPVTGCEGDDSCYWDWHIDLYPKGVTFKKCMMIGMLENREIDEVLYKTVRLTVTSNTLETRKVKISVMVIGEEEGMEYVVKGLTKTCIFDEDHVLCNISDIIPYTDLHGDSTEYKIGEKRDTMKVTVVIRPALS